MDHQAPLVWLNAVVRTPGVPERQVWLQGLTAWVVERLPPAAAAWSVASEQADAWPAIVGALA